MSLNALEIRVTSAIGNAIFVIIYGRYKKRPLNQESWLKMLFSLSTI